MRTLFLAVLLCYTCLFNAVVAAPGNTVPITIQIRVKGEVYEASRFAEGVDPATGLPINMKVPYNASVAIYCPTITRKDASDYRYYWEMDGSISDSSGWQSAQNFSKILVPGKEVVYFGSVNAWDSHLTFAVCNTRLGCEETMTTFSYYAAAPFYQTTWFKVLMVMLEVLVIGGIIGLIIRFRYKRKQKLQELTNRASQMELKALRSQMNPHFLFNSLSSIQNLVNQGQSEEANLYLSNYANLMRKILDHSEAAFISLADELEAVRLYLELEVLRFDFDYAFEVPESLDVDAVEIPPMLLQPYVENAVMHGLLAKEMPGKLRIILTQRDQHIVCTIEDNGIGRKKAMELKQGKTHQKSHGMRLNEERLQLLNEKGAGSFKVEVEDLFDESKVAAGTRVTIFIPIAV